MDFNWFFRFFKEKPVTHDADTNSQESGNNRFKNSAYVPFSDGFSTIDNSFDTHQLMMSQMAEILKMFSYYSMDHEDFSDGSLKKKTPREELLRDPNEVPPFFGFQNEGSSVLQDYDHEIFSNSGFKKKTPREELLRDPNEALPFSGVQSGGSSVLQDYDIDQVSTHSPQLHRFSDATPELHFFKKFSSIRRVHLPDGIVEERHVTSDSEGNSVTTIRRSIGDKTHEVITHSDSKGFKETVENFKNLEENEVFDFDKRLQSFINSQVPAAVEQQKLPTNDINAPPGDSSYLSLFQKFFGK